MLENLIVIWLNRLRRNIRRSRWWIFWESMFAYLDLVEAGFHITHGKLSTGEDIYRFWWNDHIIQNSPDICQPTPDHWCAVFNGGRERLSRYTRDDIALR